MMDGQALKIKRLGQQVCNHMAFCRLGVEKYNSNVQIFSTYKNKALCRRNEMTPVNLGIMMP